MSSAIRDCLFNKLVLIPKLIYNSSIEETI